MTDASTIRRNLENTLKKLRTDYLDVYLIHNIQAPAWPEIQRRDILNEYEKFKQEGLIRAIGFSYHGGLDTFRQVLSTIPGPCARCSKTCWIPPRRSPRRACAWRGKRAAPW